MLLIQQKKPALTTVENKVPNVTNLATETELTVVKNKIHDVSSLVKKTDYNSRVAEIDNKDAEKKTTKNVSIENELKGLVKDLAFFLWTNALFDG